MSLSSLSAYTFKSRYAKYNPKKRRRENWGEVTDRVFEMHARKFEKELKNPEFKEAFDFAKQMMKEKRVFGSQRALQYAIDPIFHHNSRLYNCCATYIDRTRAFAEVFYMLLSGCGVGFSVQKRHVNKLPFIGRSPEKVNGTKTFIIPDTIEGWSDVIDELMNHYFVTGYNYGTNIKFDYSQIRPQGAHITGGFKAPGPEPLKKSIELITEMLDKVASEGGRQLRPIEVYDIIMHIADAVISGGVRRCWAEGSLVYTKKGLVPIENINIGDDVLTFDGYQKVTNKFDQGKQDTLKVITEDGEFYVTPNHKMAVYKNLYEYEWKMAKDLKENDLLVSTRTAIEGIDTKLPSFNYIKPPSSTTCKDIIIPELTPDIAWWLGELCGDGYIKILDDEYTGGIIDCTFHIDDKVQAEKFANIYTKFGLSPATIKIDEKQHCIRVRKKSRQLAVYLNSWLKQPNTEIRVHECILKAKPEIKLAFLAGVMDADGSIATGRGQHILSTVYYNFAKDLQNIMYSLGLHTRLKEHKRCEGDFKKYNKIQPIFKLYLLTQASKLALQNCDQLHKKPTVNGSQRNCESFPGNWCKQFLTKISRKKYCPTAKSLTYQFVCENEKHYNTKFAPVKVKKVENYKFINTWDIEVDNRHEFVCEGYLSHNSACITLFDKDDEEMVNSKSEAFWWEKHPQRMRSNNSVVLKRDEITKEEFDNIFERTKNFGEPGFIFVSDYNNLVNPCAEISLRPALFDDNGEIIASGFSCCNLTEIIASKCETEEDFYKACRASAIIGTMQATYTSFPYLGKVTEEIAKRDALLGCSITGFMDKPELFFNPGIQRKGAEIVKDTNIKIAKLLNIRPARRTTTVKPSGTTSILGKTGSGIHPHHAKRYIRRVQAIKNEFCYNFFKAYNPHAIEENVIGSRDGRTGAILFPCEVPSGSITKNQLPAIEFLKHIRLTQDNWIKYGVNKDLCDKNDKNLAHNVSNTVVVRPEEWEEVRDFIFENKEYFCGISLLAMSGDLDYKNAPFTTVHTPSEIVKEYGDASVMASGVICAALEAYDNDLWDACNDVIYNKEIEFEKQLKECYNKNLEQKIKWIKQAKRFADKYIEGDYKRMTYLLKDVCNWKLFLDLKRQWQPIPWDDATEDEEVEVDIDTLGAISCNGGQCELNI